MPDRRDYSKLLESKGERALSVKRCETVEEVLRGSDVSWGDSGRRAWVAQPGGHRQGASLSRAAAPIAPPPPPQVVSLHCNLDANTLHLMNAARLQVRGSSTFVLQAHAPHLLLCPHTPARTLAHHR